MYTDGLVERRGRPFDAGVAQASHHLATLPDRLSPNRVIDSLLETMLEDTTADADDTVILVIEHMP
jgi:hypothetical protein